MNELVNSIAKWYIWQKYKKRLHWWLIKSDATAWYTFYNLETFINTYTVDIPWSFNACLHSYLHRGSRLSSWNWWSGCYSLTKCFIVAIYDIRYMCFKFSNVWWTFPHLKAIIIGQITQTMSYWWLCLIFVRSMSMTQSWSWRWTV